MAADLHAHAAHDATHDEPGHPDPAFYVLIGVILTVITAAEVAVFYIPALAAVLVYILLSLSLVKFVLVVMFYMHLKFDSLVLAGVFVAPLTLAVAMIISLIVLFKVLPAYTP